MATPTVDKTSGKPRRKGRWLQFGLPTLLGVMTLVAVVLGLVVNPAERQRRAVAAIREMGGLVTYDYELDRRRQWDTILGRQELPGPDLVCRLFGVDYFADVTDVDFDR